MSQGPSDALGPPCSPASQLLEDRPPHPQRPLPGGAEIGGKAEPASGGVEPGEKEVRPVKQRTVGYEESTGAGRSDDRREAESIHRDGGRLVAAQETRVCQAAAVRCDLGNERVLLPRSTVRKAAGVTRKSADIVMPVT